MQNMIIELSKSKMQNRNDPYPWCKFNYSKFFFFEKIIIPI